MSERWWKRRAARHLKAGETWMAHLCLMAAETAKVLAQMKARRIEAKA